MRSSYVPEPKTFLHHASAEVKQLWTVAVLLLMARASAPVRLAVVGVLALATMAALPRRLWEPQLLRLGGLCGVLFFFTLIGEQGGRRWSMVEGWQIGCTSPAVCKWCKQRSRRGVCDVFSLLRPAMPGPLPGRAVRP